MVEFNTSLLREKFTIRDVMPEKGSDAKPLVALSNRLVLPFLDPASKVSETFVVRAQNMHTCVRLGARLAQDFQEHGPLLERMNPFDWGEAWDDVTKGFESKFNPKRWVSIYHKGRVLFQFGEENRHPFLDIIESCDARNKGDYENAVRVAEDAFKTAGKLVTIEHDANVAMVLNVTPSEGKCGVIVRGPNRTATFNFNARKRAGRDVKPSQCLSLAAAYLEGVQLAFSIGMTRQKILYDLIDKRSDDARRAEEGYSRLHRLTAAVRQVETMLDVNYRPEPPNFQKMVDEASEFARQVLAAEIERKIQSGEIDPGDWVL